MHQTLKTMNNLIIPALIATSQAELEKRLGKIKPLKPKLVQLDVMDGQFVPHTSFEFDFTLPKGTYEAHLMMQHPEPWFIKNQSHLASIVLHYESQTHLHQLITSARVVCKQVGIALKPETEVESIVQYLKQIDKVLVMTVHPGQYGARFVPETLEKIKKLRKLAPKLDIEVDGGITPETLERCKDAGANQFVVGSFLQDAPDVKNAWKELHERI